MTAPQDFNTPLPFPGVPGSVNPEELLEGAPGTEPLGGDPTADDGGPAVQLSGQDLREFSRQLDEEYRVADSDREEVVQVANASELGYNLAKYKGGELPFRDAVSLSIPATVARIDKVASELASAYDRDGSPIFKAISQGTGNAHLRDHKEKFFHRLMMEADAMRHFRLSIKRAIKVGQSFFASEVISQPTPLPTGQGGGIFGDNPSSDNILSMRSIKTQDMYLAPFHVQYIQEAAFVGERFQMTRWMFQDYVAHGLFQEPTTVDGQSWTMATGFANDQHGQFQEFQRLRSEPSNRKDLASSSYDLMRGWLRYRPAGSRFSKLYYCVFPVGNPHVLLRLRENPYSFLDAPPYTCWNVDEGDGVLWGRGYVELLKSLQLELDNIHMLRLEAAKRGYGSFYLARRNSMLADTIAQRSGDGDLPRDPTNDAAPVKGLSARIYNDEFLETENPDADLKQFQVSPQPPVYQNDEQRIITFMSDATTDTAPLPNTRSVFEIRQMAGQAANKFKSYLKILNSTGMRPQIRIIEAQVWEYMMEQSYMSEALRFMDYADKSIPITFGDYFSSIQLEPAGTTTSADEAVAMTTSAALAAEVLPIILQTPGIVKDPLKAAREIIKYRVKTLGAENYVEIIGLEEPSAQDIEKQMMYIQAMNQANNAQGMSNPQNQGGQPPMMGGDGGMLGGMQNGNPSQMMPQQGRDMTGGSENGVAPVVEQEMGGQ